MSVLLCVGSRSQNSCYISRFDIHLYSIEELCCLIGREAFNLEDDDFNDNLLDWIETGCRLKDLADSIRQMKSDGAPVAVLASAVLDYVHYQNDEEIEDIRKRIIEGNGLDRYDREMNRALRLLNQNRLMQALHLYGELEGILPEDALEKRARVCHNEGVIFSRLFSFRRAADCFKREYEYVKSRDAVLAYLCAARMSMSDREYIDLVADSKKSYPYSLDIEKRISNVDLLYDASDDKRRLRILNVLHNEGKLDEFREEFDKLTEEMKSTYRDMTRIC